jgi:hypothetical protein
MVYTADSSRQGILDAIRKRHTYGAMDNVVMDVRLGSHSMGDEFSLRKAEPLRVRLRGTRKIANVAVIKDGKIIYSVQAGQQNVQFEFRDTGSSVPALLLSQGGAGRQHAGVVEPDVR